MKQLAVFTLSLLINTSCQAQVIRFCEDGNPDTSVCAKSIAGAFENSKGILLYKNAPLEICSLGGAFGISFGINELYRKAGFQLNCEEVSADKPFNNKKYGLKNGVWFKLTLLGRVKSAVQYDSGRAGIVITFWPNGLPRHIIKYNTSGKPVQGSSEFYKK